MHFLVHQVVEATSANGLCTVRVKALPIPAQLASILGNHEDLLMRTFASERNDLAHSNGSHDQHASSAAPEQASMTAESNGHSMAGSHSTSAAPGSNGNPDLSSLSLADKAADSASQTNSTGQEGTAAKQTDGDQQHASSAGGIEQSRADQVKSADIGHLQDRLQAAAKEAGQPVQDLFQRAWMLGPHRVSLMYLAHHTTACGGMHGAYTLCVANQCGFLCTCAPGVRLQLRMHLEGLPGDEGHKKVMVRRRTTRRCLSAGRSKPTAVPQCQVRRALERSRKQYGAAGQAHGRRAVQRRSAGRGL